MDEEIVVVKFQTRKKDVFFFFFFVLFLVFEKVKESGRSACLPPWAIFAS